MQVTFGRESNARYHHGPDAGKVWKRLIDVYAPNRAYEGCIEWIVNVGWRLYSPTGQLLGAAKDLRGIKAEAQRILVPIIEARHEQG